VAFQSLQEKTSSVHWDKLRSDLPNSLYICSLTPQSGTRISAFDTASLNCTRAIFNNYRVHKSRHWSLCLGRCIQFITSRPNSLRSILITFPSALRSSEWPLLVHSSDQIVISISHLYNACYMLCPSHLPWSDHPNSVWWSDEVMKSLIMQSSPSSHHFLPLINVLERNVMPDINII
jgi:hypothetical protein